MDIEFVRSEFDKEGYVLLSDKYVNSRSKLRFKCPKGHEYSMTWSNWQRGNRCAICAKNVRHAIDFVKGTFEEEGYMLLSTNYTNQKQKLNYICPNGHEHSITWTDWYNGGYRCPTCWSISITGEGNHEWKGGVSFDGYCPIWKDKDYKNDIRERDGFKCNNPNCDSKNPEDLVIHHIDYNRKNCHPNNLITICRICNIIANKNREWHKEFYTSLIRNRFNFGGNYE